MTHLTKMSIFRIKRILTVQYTTLDCAVHDYYSYVVHMSTAQVSQNKIRESICFDEFEDQIIRTYAMIYRRSFERAPEINSANNVLDKCA